MTSWVAPTEPTASAWSGATEGVGAILLGQGGGAILLGQGGGALLLGQEVDLFTSDWGAVPAPTETTWSGV